MPNKFKAVGSDQIHSTVAQPLAELRLISVTQLYNFQTMEGKVREEWKTAVVVGRHNDGPRHKPVGLTCILCNCLESTIRKQIREHLVNHSVVLATQHG